MNFLNGHRVLALMSAADGALPRFLASLGATVLPVTLAEMEAQLADELLIVSKLHRHGVLPTGRDVSLCFLVGRSGRGSCASYDRSRPPK